MKSVTIPLLVLEDTNLTETEFRMYCIIHAFVEACGSCFETNRMLGQIAGKEIKTVQRAIRGLERKGYIKSDYNKDFNFRDISLCRLSDSDSDALWQCISNDCRRKRNRQEVKKV